LAKLEDMAVSDHIFKTLNAASIGYLLQLTCLKLWSFWLFLAVS